MMNEQRLLHVVFGAPTAAVASACCSVILYYVSLAIYNIYFHPLSKYPGPASHAASRIPYCLKLLRGTLPFDMLELHEKYGDVVRLAPDELAFSNPQAWKDIMGHRPGGEEMGKYMKFYKLDPTEPENIVNAPREMHSRLRRQLAHGFSDKSMREQEPQIDKYVKLLVKQLRHFSGTPDDPKPVNISSWYNFTTFDLIGDLAFGEPFGCLEKAAYHPWVKTLLSTARAGTFMQSANFFPTLKMLLLKLIPKSLKEAHEQNLALTKDKLARRMANPERPDLIEGLLKKDGLKLTLPELEVNANILVIGGSETTATLLAGATFLLLSNPSALTKVTEELRSTFSNEDEINITSVGKLEYMLACLNEALRLYPPVPISNPRQVPGAGGTVCGQFIPGGTVVSIYQWAAYHREKFFTKPFEFHPERFLGDPLFSEDKRDILQPFSFGPRNCIGRNLAYSEMRLILARVLYNFDIKLADDSVDWLEKQKVFFFWSRGPLNIYLTPAKSA